jgi:L-iditol 2-dehydrogenase
MIAATFTQGGNFEIREVARPEITEDEILLRVKATSICGTDIKIIRNGHRKLKDGERIVLGHEFAGVIEQIGSAVKGFSEGQTIGVAPNWGCGHCRPCRHGMANYCAEYQAFGITRDGSHTQWVRVPAEVIAQGNILPLPDDVSWSSVSLAEPLSCVLGGQTAVRLSAGESVLIYGAGPMGLLHILAARAAGAAIIIAVDPNVARLTMARELGATHAVQSDEVDLRTRVDEITGGEGLDVVITAVPVPEIVPEGLSLLGIFGRICLFAGLPKDRAIFELDGNLIHYKNLFVTGTTGGCNADYAKSLNLITSGAVPVEGIISHRFSLQQLSEAYETALAGCGMKIVITS